MITTTQTSIADVLTTYGVEIPKAAGGYVNVHCYADDDHEHGDKRKSGSVNLRLDYYVCFGCGRYGTAAQLLADPDHGRGTISPPRSPREQYRGQDGIYQDGIYQVFQPWLVSEGKRFAERYRLGTAEEYANDLYIGLREAWAENFVETDIPGVFVWRYETRGDLFGWVKRRAKDKVNKAAIAQVKDRVALQEYQGVKRESGLSCFRCDDPVEERRRQCDNCADWRKLTEDERRDAVGVPRVIPGTRRLLSGEWRTPNLDPSRDPGLIIHGW